MIRAQAKAGSNLDQVELSITFTAPVETWRQLMRQLGTQHRSVDRTYEPFEVKL